MKKFNSIGKYLLAVCLLAFANNSCTDLEEKLYSEVPQSEYDVLIKNLDVPSALLAAYGQLTAVAASHNSIWANNEVATDEMLIPQRGGDWYDGGQWIRMHRHEYTKSEDSFNNGWNSMYRGVAICNRLIVQVPIAQPANAAAVVAELRALRALYYYYILDMWGKGPIFTKFPGDIAEAGEKSSADLYNFIDAELKAVVGSLSANVDASTYGRINQFGARALQAKLYLNAQKYAGKPAWAETVAACDAIISANKYSVDTSYSRVFWFGNENNREHVFVVPYEPGTLGGIQIVQMTGHYETQKTFDLQAQPWNGYCTLADFYNSYDATDKRRAASFWVGPQFASDGRTRLEDANAESNDPDGKPLTFTPEVNQHFPGALRQAGARVGKYRPRNGSSPDISNDYPIFRYADVLLMKAEAQWRQDPASAAALATFNQIRTRAGVPAWTAAQMTATNILAELGREKFAEGWRRQDMIRFGKYFNAYDKFKPANGEAACKGVFPIPGGQIDANKQLSQNECYK
jgi:starch-binding outer membrane protein, SusD/RagB family